MEFEKQAMDSPRPLIHISTGVVYASPGVVKIPPWVLTRSIYWIRARGDPDRRDGNALVLRKLSVEIDALYSDELEALVDD